MKSALVTQVLIASLSFSSAFAFGHENEGAKAPRAKVYTCATLKNSSGQVRVGSPAFQVSLYGGHVTLHGTQSDSMNPYSYTLPMRKTEQEVGFAVFTARNGVSATLSTDLRFPGVTLVAIKLGDSTAECNLPEDETPAAE